MCWWATKKTSSWVLASRVRKQAQSLDLTQHAFCDMIDRGVDKFPQIKVVATTLREVHSTNHHTWGAVAWINGKILRLSHL